jgi:hypothetical protein
MAKVRFDIPKDATDEEVVEIIRDAGRKAKLAEGPAAPDEVPEGGVEGDLPDDDVEAGSEFL